MRGSHKLTQSSEFGDIRLSSGSQDAYHGRERFSFMAVLDGYEDEPAAFGVPPYVGFHIRYVCGVLEQHKIDYTYLTIDQWRLFSEEEQANHLRDLKDLSALLVLLSLADTFEERFREKSTE